MSPRILKPLVSLASLGTLAACAGTSGDYPSLQTRPGERVSGTFEVNGPDAQPAAAPAPASADLVARLGELSASADAAHADFLEALPRAQRLAAGASGAAIGSDAWASAQVALADLDSARSRAAIPLATLDELYLEATVADTARGEISDTRDAVIAMLEEQDAVLAQLRSTVR